MFTFNGFLAKLKTKFSTNKTPTNNHRFPLVLSDGTPDGNATPADIMQLLGVLKFEGQIANLGSYADFLSNNSDQTWRFAFALGVPTTDWPEGYGFCIGFRRHSNSEFILYITSENNWYVNVKNSGAYKGWRKIDVTNV